MARSRFCSIPFTEFRVSTSGDLSICSPQRMRIPTVGNILRDGVEVAWNSQEAQQIRSSILDGSFSLCKPLFCPALQNNALPKADAVTDPKFRHIIDNGTTVIEEGPEQLNLHYDITCNLKCPTCRTEIIGLKGRDLERVLRIKDMMLESNLFDNARQLILCGYGDPLASRPHLAFLRGIDAQRLRKLRISLLTNGLLLTPRMWSSFPRAHPLIREIAISVDAATPQTYGLNRGGDFSRLLENLAFVAELRRTGAIEVFRLNYVVQANNFSEMENFVELGRRLGADRIIFQKIANAPNAHMGDYAARAVHLPAHPQHADFQQVLEHSALRDPIVDLYTLAGVRVGGDKPAA